MTAFGYFIYSYFEKVVGKNVEAAIPKGNVGSDQYTVPEPDSVAVEPTFIAFL